MAQFSGAIKIGDLNDYIAPSQACVVALSGKKLQVQDDMLQPQVAEVQLQPRISPAAPPGQHQAPAPGEAVKVSLHDCLACSGCITSAETVLLQHQSGDEFAARLADPSWHVVVTVSPQSRAALAAFFGLSPANALRHLTGWLLSRGVKAVFDLQLARELALMEGAAEFIARYKEAQAQGGKRTAMPVLASACPGWVCYAEKTHGDTALPHLSRVKSPQGVAGTLVKRLLAPALGIDPARIYHTTVMPCYDKKLEASRDELTLPGGIPEVDCCLTTGEVYEMLAAAGLKLTDTSQASPASFMRLIRQSTAQSSSQPVNASIYGCATDDMEVDMAGVSDSTPIIHPHSALPALAPHTPDTASLEHHAAALSQQQCADADASCVNTMDTDGPEFAPSNLSMQSILDPAHQQPRQYSAHIHNHQLGPPHNSLSFNHPAIAPISVTTPPLHTQHDSPQDSQSPGTCLSASDAADDGQLYGLPGGSGGYMEFVFRTAAQELFGRQLAPGPLNLRALRNADFQEVILEGDDGQPLLRFAQAYGFRNIQTLMRRLKTGKCEWQYIEVMACPSGCLNGGGQLKPQPGQTATQLLEQLEMKYHDASVVPRHPADNAEFQELYRSYVQAGVGSEAAKQLLHTTFTKREKTVTSAVGDW